jgi:hypothetical protein
LGKFSIVPIKDNPRGFGPSFITTNPNNEEWKNRLCENTNQAGINIGIPFICDPADNIGQNGNNNQQNGNNNQQNGNNNQQNGNNNQQGQDVSDKVHEKIQYLVIMKVTTPSPIMFNRILKMTIRMVKMVKIAITIVTTITTKMVMMVIMNKTLNNIYQMNKERETQIMNLMMMRMETVISEIPTMVIALITGIIRVTITMTMVLELLVWISV